jgi:predicted metal-binding membrane protein
VIWMAGLGIVMSVEKMVPGTLIRRGVGVALLLIAAVLAGRQGVLAVQ